MQRVTCLIRPHRRSGTRDGQSHEGHRGVEMRRGVTEIKGYRREHEIIACTAIVENRAKDCTFSESQSQTTLPTGNLVDLTPSELLQSELRWFKRMLGLPNFSTHKIKQRYFPKNRIMQEVLHKKIDELLEKSCIEPSYSLLRASRVLAKKKNGKWRPHWLEAIECSIRFRCLPVSAYRT